MKQDIDYGLNQQRYAGRPLLRLLDCYVLALTGNLAPDVEAKVAQAVQTAFGGGADWKASLRNALDLPPTMDERVRGGERAASLRPGRVGRQLPPDDRSDLTSER